MKNIFITLQKPLAFLLVAILLGGVYCYFRIQTSLFPEVTFPKIKVIADAGLQPADKMVATVTSPLENTIKQVPGIKTIRSTTSRGSCEVSALLEWNTDIDQTHLQIASRINEMRDQLPAGTRYTVEKMNPSILPVIGYSLESSSRSLIDLKYLATYTVKPFLSQVEGVAAVRILGGKDKEFRVVLNQQKMSSLGITTEALQNSIAASGFIQSNGYISELRRMYLSLIDATVHNKSDLEHLVIRNTGNRSLTLGEIAEVKIEKAIEFVRISANGQEGVLINIVKYPSANLISTTAAVQDKLAELQRILPPDVHIRPYYEQADFVNAAIRSVKDSLWIGLALAILVALLFLRSFKAGTTLLLVVPLILSGALVVLYALGYTFNIMTLGALVAAIGLIIDDAVVIVEQIHRTHEEHPEKPTTELVGQAIQYLLPAMIGSSLSTIVIFLPFVLMTGVAGAYFQIMTNTMMITLICSFVLTWLGVPIIYLMLSQGKRKKVASQGRQGHEVKPQAWVTFFTHRPAISLVFIALLVLGVVLVFPQLPTGFLPEMDEGSIVLDYASPPGTSLEETNQMLSQVDKVIGEVPEVAAFSRRTGAQMGFFITEANSGDYLIELKADRSRSTDVVIDEIRGRVEQNVPALIADFGQVITDMLGDLTTSVQPIEIKIFGSDQKQLQALARQVAAQVEQVPGTADVFDGIVVAGPAVRIMPDFAQLAQYGLTAAGLQAELQTAIEGNVVGQIFQKGSISNIRVSYHDSSQYDLGKLRSQPVFLPGGGLIPVNRVASITISPGETEVERENLQNMGVVTARLNGRDLGGVIQDIQAKLSGRVTLPPGYHIQYGGEYLEQQQSFQELLVILGIAIALVFVVILFLFREISAACIIIGVAVLGLSGGYFALFLTHTPLNVGSYTGLIMIVGILGENAIFTYLQYKNALHQYQDVHQAIAYSISTRLRPKLMTALCAITAMLPLALGIGTGAELHQPLAITVIGGFIIGLPLLLIVLPSLLKLSQSKKRESK